MTPSDPTRDLAEWFDGQGYVVCEWDADPEWAGRSALTPVEGWEDAARDALAATPAPACRHDAKWIEEYTSWVIRAHEERAALSTTPAPAEPKKRERIDWSNVVVDEGDEAP